MRTTRTIVAVTALATMFEVPARAFPSETAPVSDICDFAAFTDPTAEPGTETGLLGGGPLTLPSIAGVTVTPGAGTLTCRIQVGTSNHTGAGPQVQGHGTGVVSAGPSQVAYVAGLSDDVYLCAEYTSDQTGTTYYFDAASTNWSTSRLVDCDLAFATSALDPTFCALLTTAWDCDAHWTIRSPGNGKGHGKHTKGQPPVDLVPYYPAGTVKISNLVPGQISFDYSNFTPPPDQWDCVEASMSVSCTPPAAAAELTNVCGTVAVSASSWGMAVVAGDTQCSGSPNGATAVATGPATPASSQSATEDSGFPWTCAVSADGAGPWEVTCTVG